jgi:hypothetical protein
LSQSRPRSVRREGDVLVSMEASGSRTRLIRNLLLFAALAGKIDDSIEPTPATPIPQSTSSR